LHDGAETWIVVGAGPDMWPVFTCSAEYSDGGPDPLDRWSKRILGARCAPHGWTTEFPSDGPPYAPFIAWAKATGRFWNSPTGMLVHDEAGLMVSIRGAIRVANAHLRLPQSVADSPCDTCANQPCTTACPVGALSATAPYDVPGCKVHLDAPHGRATCMAGGCLARRICPVSAAFGRDPVQSAFHMRSFHRA